MLRINAKKTTSVAILCLVWLSPFASSQDKKSEEPSYRGRTLSEWRRDLKAEDAEVRRKAALALAQMKAEAKPAVRDLAVALKDTNLQVRVAAATAIWRLGPIAKDAAPEVIRAYKEAEDEEVRLMAGYALGKIGTASKDVVPTFCEVLRTGESKAKRQAALILGQMGPDARDAVPDLIKVFDNKMDADASKQAGEALKKIDPEAAEKAGVK
jgi:HEAT repeat protein